MNIELHGFLPEKVKDIAEAVWSKLIANLSPDDSSDCVVTIVPSQSYDKRGRNTPFIRVYSDKKTDFELTIKLLKPVKMPGAGMKTYVECILLHKCLEL